MCMLACIGMTTNEYPGPLCKAAGLSSASLLKLAAVNDQPKGTKSLPNFPAPTIITNGLVIESENFRQKVTAGTCDVLRT